MSARHNSNVVITDQLPDENDIERLFPKCPPKQVMFSGKNKQKNFNSRRKRINNIQMNDNNKTKIGCSNDQTTNIPSSSTINNNATTTATTITTRKQPKIKIHQHSRRELEARRSRITTSPPNEKSSSSSDEQQNQKYGNNNKFHNSSSNKTYNNSSGSRGRDEFNFTRRGGKYTASQSLIQQLKRSQSNTLIEANNQSIISGAKNNHNNNDNNNNINATRDNPALMNNKPDCSNETIDQTRGIIRSSSGIVKSISSYAFSNESSINSVINKNPSATNMSPNHCININNSNNHLSSINQVENQPLETFNGNYNEQERNVLSKSNNNSTIQNVQFYDEFDKTNNNNAMKNDFADNNWNSSSRISKHIEMDQERVIEELSNHVIDNMISSFNSKDLQIENVDINKKNNNNKNSIKFLPNDKSINNNIDDNNNKNCQQQIELGSEILDNGITLRNDIPVGVTVCQTADTNFMVDAINDISNKGPTEIQPHSSDSSTEYSNTSSIIKDRPQNDFSLKTNNLNEIDAYFMGNNERLIETSSSLNRSLSNKNNNNNIVDNELKADQQIIQDSKKQKNNYSKNSNNRYQARNKQRLQNRLTERSSGESIDSKENIDIAQIIEEEESLLDDKTIQLRSDNQDSYLENSLINNSNNKNEIHLSSLQNQDVHDNPNVISIENHASQQLLTLDSVENDDNIIRNDASTEELCSNEDNINISTNLKTTKIKEFENNSRTSIISDINFDNKVQNYHKSNFDTLASVDETAEINIENSAPDNTQEILETYEEKQEELVDHTNNSNMRASKQPNLINRSFNPPGYTQRIRPQTNFDSKGNNIQNSNENHDNREDNNKLISDPKIGSLNEQTSDNRICVQRVKFDNDNLVTIKSDSNIDIQSASICQDKRYQRADHIGQMPIINESQIEGESEAIKESLSAFEKELSNSISKINLNSISNSSNSINNSPADNNNINSVMTKPNIITVKSENILLPTRSSSLQFNTLSDNESGNEDPINTTVTSNRDYNSGISNKCDGNSINISHMNNSSTSNIKIDDDLAPTIKTALIFPRLDEGLSSDAESCEDDIEDDDERAMEADVDADDDEDDDDDDEDDDDDDDDESQSNQIGSISRNDNYTQRQPQSMKSQSYNPVTINQDHSIASQNDVHHNKPSSSNYVDFASQDQLENKSFNNNNNNNNNNNYLNQNGQSNYWLSTANHQTNLSSQSTSNQQLNNQQLRNNNNNSSNNNNSIAKANSFNRDEAKATSRLSSDTDNETDRLLGSQRNDQLKLNNNDISSNTDLQPVNNVIKQNASSREVLIEGVLFNVKYLGSTHTDCEGRGEKEDRIHQAEMAVHEVKFRNGEFQVATEVQLFISTEKIMVLDDKQRKIMMDHSLRTISYIADIGDAIVLIVRKKNTNHELNELGRPISKISCHVFESSESHTITKSISQAFQVAYTELLKANGGGDATNYLPKELDYQEVLNSQEMSTDELEMFARKENQREVVVPKKRGEILGLSIVESGWGSVLPTVVIANLKQDSPAYNCKKLSIGDQILSVNGVSLVGLSLGECQEILKRTKKQRVAKLSVVPCPVTVEVKIKRPDTKYQLGFSVQNGVICSLLRGGIAERGGVRVGHRIMSINGTTVVGVPHEKIVTLLASSVGEIRMKTCLTSLYRLMLGDDKPKHI